MKQLVWMIFAPLLAGCSDYEIIMWEGVDTFQQNPVESVDILLVVDNSGSMDPYQEELGKNFNSFLTYFIEAEVDYHIATVTTDVVADGAGQISGGTIIDTETSNADQVFTDIVNVGTVGSGNEMGLEGAYLALTEPLISTANAGFLREEASLSILFVSDEEDSSPRPVNDYINDFRNIKGQRARDVFNASALTVVDLHTCDRQEAAYSTVNTRYVDMANQTNGIVGDICEEDFSNIVTDLSLNASRLRDTFYLSSTPDASSLRVWVGDEQLDCDSGRYTYDMVAREDEDSTGDTGLDSGEQVAAILFPSDDLPPANSTIVVRYMYGDGDPAAWCTGEQDTGSGSGESR